MILRFIFVNIFVLLFLFFNAITLLSSSTSAYASNYKNEKTNNSEPILVDKGIVKKIIKSNMLLLENNKSYKLENIRVPFDYSLDAIEALSKLLVGKEVFLYKYNKNNRLYSDRYGFDLVQAIRDDDGIWVQDYLVSKGLSWAYSSNQSRKMALLLKQVEKIARSSKLGFWANKKYAVKTPETVKKHLNSYQVVEGRILKVGIVKRAIYINFGKSFKDDFTIILKKTNWNKFIKQDPHFNALHWIDRFIRISGWVEDKNGPLIELTHPEQIYFFKKRKKKKEKNKGE